MKTLKCRILVHDFEVHGPMPEPWEIYEYEAPEGFENEVGCGILFLHDWDPNTTRVSMEVVGVGTRGCDYCSDLMGISSLSPSVSEEWICPKCVQANKGAVDPRFDGWRVVSISGDFEVQEESGPQS